jgi:hypothetical protein
MNYAATATTGRRGGTVRWGLLTDSDNIVGYTTRTAQPNWAVSFKEPLQQIFILVLFFFEVKKYLNKSSKVYFDLF